jgi:hypothetical protein
MDEHEARPAERGHGHGREDGPGERRGGGPGHGRHGGRHGGKRGGHGERDDGRSAQTFRRGRALAFLERLQLRRSTLERQLGRPELNGIREVISGELKATDQIIGEFIHAFELHEAMAPADSGEDAGEGGEPSDA